MIRPGHKQLYTVLVRIAVSRLVASCDMLPTVSNSLRYALLMAPANRGQPQARYACMGIYLTRNRTPKRQCCNEVRKVMKDQDRLTRPMQCPAFGKSVLTT